MLREMIWVLKEGVVVWLKNSIFLFQVFCISMVVCVGIGNIIGIVIVIVFGGLGVIFWMWIIVVIGLVLSFVESMFV